MNATRTYASHADCSHLPTPSARRICRKIWADVEAARLAMPHPIGLRVRYVGSHSTPAGVVGIVAAHDLDYHATGVHPDGAPADVIQFALHGEWVAAV